MLFRFIDEIAGASEAVAQLAEFRCEGGRLLLEIGDDQFDAVRALLTPAFEPVSLIRDMNGKPRVVQAERNNA